MLPIRIRIVGQISLAGGASMFRKRICFLEAGLAKASFALPYRGGMIWCEHLDSLGEHTDEALDKLESDLLQFKKPSATSQLVVVLDETLVNQDLCNRLVDAFTAPDSHAQKLAFVGLDWAERRRLEKAMQGRSKSFTLRYFTDLEKAKEWLMPL